MAFKPPKASSSGGYKVSQEINLNEFFDFDFTGKDELKQIIGEAILEHIRNRTLGGTSVKFNDDGNASFGSFKKYSQKYKDSMQFKAFGKSDGKVDLKLSGDMLELMDFEIKGNKIVIGWGDDEQNAKAYNHQTGDTVPKRPFFGISKGELLALKTEFGSDLEKAVTIKDEQGVKAFNEFANELIGKIKDGDS